jgi:carboxylesterase type B
VRKADKFGLSCTQPVFASMDGTEPVKEMSEDCLYLNVWTAPPAVGAQVLRPVMVWIHGGGFTIGEACRMRQPLTQVMSTTATMMDGIQSWRGVA